jgi:hypothetical protein
MKMASVRTLKFTWLLALFASGVLALSASGAHAGPSGSSRGFQTDWPFVHTAVGPHDVQVMNGGLTSFDKRLSMIENAKSSID